MRDIKFRAWEAANAQMNYDPRFIAWESAAGMPLYAINRANQEPDVVLMEYTGLKDKNGKDIYEGDILKGGNGGLVQCEDALRVFYSSAEAARQLEVVGNIYENPELLKNNRPMPGRGRERPRKGSGRSSALFGPAQDTPPASVSAGAKPRQVV